MKAIRKEDGKLKVNIDFEIPLPQINVKEKVDALKSIRLPVPEKKTAPETEPVVKEVADPVVTEEEDVAPAPIESIGFKINSSPVVDAAPVEKVEKKKKQLLYIRIAIIALAAVAVLSLVFTVIPFVRDFAEIRNAYNEAEHLLKLDRFDESAAAFRALGSYSDAAVRAETEVPYAKAVSIFTCAEAGSNEGLTIAGKTAADIPDGDNARVLMYNEAIAVFESLDGYGESADYIARAKAAIEEYYEQKRLDAYNAACGMLENGLYLEARDAFAAMDGYKDSEQMMTECIYRRDTVIYDFVCSYNMRNVFAEISNESSVPSKFWLPMSMGKEELEKLSGGLGVAATDIAFTEAPEDALEICDALILELASLDGYGESTDMILGTESAGDFSREFYALLAEGKLKEAVEWLNTYDDKIPRRNSYYQWLETYQTFNAKWELFSGDATLIPRSAGSEGQSRTIRTYITIEDGIVYLHAEAEDGSTVVLSAELGNIKFSKSPSGDEIYYYYMLVNTMGRLTFSSYLEDATNVGAVEYTKA